MTQLIVFDFLNSFFNLFKANIEEYRIVDKLISGRLGWKDEVDKQDFVLKIDFNMSYLISAKLLCDYLMKNKLIDGDKIVVSEHDLVLKLIKSGWSEVEARETINFLCSFDVKMLDDGEETDSFYVHF